jgi:hypothetical protein
VRGLRTVNQGMGESRDGEFLRYGEIQGWGLEVPWLGGRSGWNARFGAPRLVGRAATVGKGGAATLAVEDVHLGGMPKDGADGAERRGCAAGLKGRGLGRAPGCVGYSTAVQGPRRSRVL